MEKTWLNKKRYLTERYMKKTILIFFVFVILCPTFVFGDYPVEHPSRVSCKVFYDGQNKPLLDAWGWRDRGDVWVELVSHNEAFSDIVMIQRKNFYVVQDGHEYKGACLALEKFKECGSFELKTNNANALGNFIYRVDFDENSDTYQEWNYKNAYRLYFKEINCPPVENNYLEIEAAVFYDLSLRAEPDDAGSVAGEGQYESGEAVSISAMPGEGYRFSHWGDDSSDVVKDKVYTMPAKDDTVIAHFIVRTRDDKDSSDLSFIDDGCFISLLNLFNRE